MSDCRLTVTMGCATMSAKFPTAGKARIILVCWVESEAETCLSGTDEERFAEACRWIEQQGGTVEITEDAP